MKFLTGLSLVVTGLAVGVTVTNNKYLRLENDALCQVVCDLEREKKKS